MQLFCRRDGENWRVWRGDWAGDQFEVFNGADFGRLVASLKRLSIEVIEMGDEDDN